MRQALSAFWNVVSPEVLKSLYLNGNCALNYLVRSVGEEELQYLKKELARIWCPPPSHLREKDRGCRSHQRLGLNISVLYWETLHRKTQLQAQGRGDKRRGGHRSLVDNTNQFLGQTNRERWAGEVVEFWTQCWGNDSLMRKASEANESQPHWIRFQRCLKTSGLAPELGQGQAYRWEQPQHSCGSLRLPFLSTEE